MDLGAYMQIEDLDEIAKRNGIEVPRLRGYRLMKNEEHISQEEIYKMVKDNEPYIVKNLIEATPYWRYNCYWYGSGSKTEKLKKNYLVYKEIHEDDFTYRKPVKIRWDRIHGWKRKELKFALKKEKKKILTQWNTWNKYIGREDVLYIHARLGSGCWAQEARQDTIYQDWVLDVADDADDMSYCDIYAKIFIDEM